MKGMMKKAQYRELHFFSISYYFVCLLFSAVCFFAYFEVNALHSAFTLPDPWIRKILLIGALIPIILFLFIGYAVIKVQNDVFYFCFGPLPFLKKSFTKKIIRTVSLNRFSMMGAWYGFLFYIGEHKNRAFKTRYERGISITTADAKYFISAKNPELLLKALTSVIYHKSEQSRQRDEKFYALLNAETQNP